MSLAANLTAPFARVLDVVLPPRCLSCQEPMSPPGGLCPDCWPLVQFLADPLCECCGVPIEDPAQQFCGPCQIDPPAFRQARAALLYDDGSRELVLRLKHADALSGVPVMARWMQRAGAAQLALADWLVPVPLHWSRLFHRRYNQSAELVRAISGFSGVPALPDGLVRTRKTPTQGGLSRTRRQANVRDAFRTLARHEGRIGGKHIVLVDDVMTTGATLDACAAALITAGAARVDALCLARVASDSGLP